MRIEDIKKNSAEDLFLRGFNREDVMELTGEDIGYHGSKYRSKVVGIDRLEYRINYIKNNFTHEDIMFVLSEYNLAKMTKESIFKYFDLAYYNDNAMKLSLLFDGLGYHDEFEKADFNYRQINLSNNLNGNSNNNSIKRTDSSTSGSLKSKQEVIAAKEASRLKKLEEKRKKEEERRLQAEMKRQAEEEKKLRIQRIRKWHLDDISNSLEDFVYVRLMEVYKKDDIERNYISEKYPLGSSFYIKSRNLYIECFGSSLHGFHWFDENREIDRNKLDELLSDYSNVAREFIRQWTEVDVEKRKHAKDSDLNYVILWDGKKYEDAKLWFAMDMPEGKDWTKEYSWLPEKDLSVWHWDYPELKKGINIAIAAARAMNGKEFYKREIALWNENPVYDNKWGTLQARLYTNRFRYQNSGTHSEENQYYRGKLPNEISELELLRGFGIGSFLNAYTVFNNSLMVSVIDKYNVKNIYDPCSGWGERGFTAAVNNIKYLGVDINPEVVEGGNRFINHYNLSEDDYKYVCADSSRYDMRNGNHDAVICCPPYGSTEIYTDIEGAAENMTEMDFLDWWDDVVYMSVAPSTKVFAFQINQEWKARLCNILIENGWTLAEELTLAKQVSHKNRKSDGESFKKEFESMMVFVR